MAKAPKPDPLADMKRDRTTHATAGRVNVERGKDGSINLRLAQWAISPDCWLEAREAKKLAEAILAALKPPKTAIAAEDNYDDIA